MHGKQLNIFSQGVPNGAPFLRPKTDYCRLFGFAPDTEIIERRHVWGDEGSNSVDLGGASF